jgi:predicted anti-sigma-YlaC factor YlaD
MNPWGMDCNELVELVTEYLEGTLGEEKRANFEKHLSLCGSCRHYLEQMRLTRLATGNLRAEDVPPDALEAFRNALRQWKKA